MTTITTPAPRYEEFPATLNFFGCADRVFFSGGLGSQLALRGAPSVDAEGLPAIASLHAPGLLAAVHADYAAAGASVLTADTFDLSPWRQEKHRGANGEAIAARGITAAYEAARAAQRDFADRPLYIAGSITTLEDCYRPDLAPDDRVLLREHFRQVALHAQNKADFLCIETIPDVREAKAIVEAAEAHGLPFTLSFTIDDNGNPLDGASIEAAERATRSPLRLGVGVNCCQIEGAFAATDRLKNIFDRETALQGQHILAYPNGYAHTRAQFQCDTGADAEARHTGCCEKKKQVIAAEDFARIAQDLRDRGATIVGGCCGTSPAHTRAYTNALGGRLRRRLAA